MYEKKLYWNRNFTYENSDEGIQIGNTIFPKEYADLFPKLWIQLCNGISEEELCDCFNELSKRKISRFISRLKNMGVICQGLQEPDELFKGQYRLLKKAGEYPEDYFLKKENVEDYRKKALDRNKQTENNVFSYDIPALPDCLWTRRSSCRKFKVNEKVTKESFMELLAVLLRYSGREFEHGTFPSAGGLYPIDAYVQVKANRVEGVQGGIYFVNPSKRKLEQINSEEQVSEDQYFFLNKDIFRTSAFSVFLVFKGEVSMLKYKDRGYFYGIIDCGIILGYLNLKAAEIGLGSCCIGELKNSDIRDILKLGSDEIFLQSAEFGIPE